MNNPTRDHRSLTDSDIENLIRAVEPHDFERIAPPPQAWNNILAELEVEVASREASARRSTQRWTSSTRLLSAAAVVLLMVGITVAVVSTADDSPNELAAAVMTDADLPVATTETADAAIVCEDNECFVELELTDLPTSGTADLELWVINNDVSDMHSLGYVQSQDGRYALPAGVTADDFPIVDISLEPDDGDPTHSGLSVLRGVFQET